MTKLWPGSPRRKRERIQINKIRNEKGEVATDTTEIKKKKTISELDTAEETIIELFKNFIWFDYSWFAMLC